MAAAQVGGAAKDRGIIADLRGEGGGEGGGKELSRREMTRGKNEMHIGT